MHLMSKEMVLTTLSWIANNSVSRTVAYPVDVLDDNICSLNLQKYATEIAYMFLGGITLALVATTSIHYQGLEEVSWQR